MLLRNHGTLAVGRTVAEGFNNAYRLERACRTQLLAQACNDEVLLPSQEVFEKTSRMYQPGSAPPDGPARMAGDAPARRPPRSFL